MEQYISKSAILAKIKKLMNDANTEADIASTGECFDEKVADAKYQLCKQIRDSIDSIEVKEVEENPLEKFKSLQHISGDLKSTLQDWGYAPNLYYFDGSWHVDWISCEEGDSIHGFTAETPEEAIDKAYKWFHSTFCNS